MNEKMKLTSAKLVSKRQEQQIMRQPLAFIHTIQLIKLLNGPQYTQFLFRAEDQTFKIENVFLWDRLKIKYAKQNANQVSGKLVSLVFTRAMEETSRESSNRELVK